MSSISSLASALPALPELPGSARANPSAGSRPDEATVPLPRGLRRDSAAISPEARALLEREQKTGLPST